MAGLKSQNHSSTPRPTQTPKSPKSQFRQPLAQPKLVAGHPQKITVPSPKSPIKSQSIPQIPQITVQTTPRPTQTRGRRKITAHPPNPPNHSSDNTSPNPNSRHEKKHSPSPKSPQITVQTTPRPTQTHGRPKITAHPPNPPNHSSDNASPNPNSWQAQNHSPSPKSPKSQFRQRPPKICTFVARARILRHRCLC